MNGEPAHERLLLVEGEGDFHAILQIWLAHHPSPDVPFHIQPCGGIPSLLERIEAEIDEETRIAVGFVFDANTDVDARRQAFTDRLHRVGPIVGKWDESGLIENRTDGTRVGAWMMPDNVSSGEIEDFLWAMIREGDVLEPLATAYVEDAARIDMRFREIKRRRAEVHSWLAVQEAPYPTGRAVQVGALDANAPLAMAFVRWLERLFVDPQ